MARKLSIQAVNELDFARLPYAPRRRFHPLRVSSLRSVGLLTVCQTTQKWESCTVIRIYLIVGNLCQVIPRESRRGWYYITRRRGDKAFEKLHQTLQREIRLSVGNLRSFTQQSDNFGTN